jgi:hypothetical protein
MGEITTEQKQYGEQYQERDQNDQAVRNILHEQVGREGQHKGYREADKSHSGHDGHGPQD